MAETASPMAECSIEPKHLAELIPYRPNLMDDPSLDGIFWWFIAESNQFPENTGLVPESPCFAVEGPLSPVSYFH